MATFLNAIINNVQWFLNEFVDNAQGGLGAISSAFVA